MLRTAFYLFLIQMSLLPFGGCSDRKAVNIRPAFPEQEYKALIDEADRRSLDGHLCAWRQAEVDYLKAWQLRPSEELRNKRITNLTLLTTRETDENIQNMGYSPRLEELCLEDQTVRGDWLCNLAAKYGRRLSLDEIIKTSIIPTPEIDPANSVDVYLDWLWIKMLSPEKAESTFAELAGRFPESALFEYGNYPEDLEDFEKTHSDFAEFLNFYGEVTFSVGLPGSARELFLKALSLIPEYTEARTGLGNVYFFSLQDYATALEIYSQTLQCDPVNAAALFGKGSALHYLGRHLESDRVLDELLANAPWSSLTEAQVAYFRAEALYYKAYNSFLTGDRDRARELVEQALSIAPASPGVRYLSGLLYFQADELEKAEKEFSLAIDHGTSNCEVFYYSGMVKLRRKTAAPWFHFESACECYTKSVAQLEWNLDRVPTMGIGEADQQALSGRIRAAIIEFKKSAHRSVETILEQIQQATDPPTAQIVQRLNEVLASMD